MLKLRSISKTDFDNYINNQKNISHFMQTSAWGEFEKVTNHITPHYLGLINKNKEIVAATLLIEEYLPMNCCYLYAPRGFIINYKNKQLLKNLIIKLKEFAKKRKAIAIKINPAINYKVYNYNKELINRSAKEVIITLKDLGFKKQSQIKLPEYTYKINLTKNMQEIESTYSENIKKRISSTEKYDVELTIGTHKDLKELFKLKQTTNNNYYETLYDIFSNNEHTKIRLFLGKIHITKTLKTIEKELKRINNQISIIPIDNLDASSKQKLSNLRKEKEKINKEYEKFKSYKLKYGNTLVISANLMMEHDNKVWILYEANNQILEETNLNYTIHNKYIKYYKDKGFNLFNQLSPLEHNPSINELKKEFGGEFTEFIGEYDLVTNKFMYLIQKKVLPLLKKTKEDTYETSNSK